MYCTTELKSENYKCNVLALSLFKHCFVFTVMTLETLLVILPGYRWLYVFLSKLESLRHDKAGMLNLNSILMGISVDGLWTGLICLLKCFVRPSSMTAHTKERAYDKHWKRFCLTADSGSNSTMSIFTYIGLHVILNC